MSTAILLKTPDLSDANIIGYNVGIRPYREHGIRLETEIIKDKLIIHSYGYGGSGLTLCWGSALEVLSLVRATHAPIKSSIAVLGAGVIGITAALVLAQAGYKVHIYANQFSPHITSNVAAGILSPPANFINESEAHKELVAKLLKNSFAVFNDHHINGEGFSGVKKLTSYRVFSGKHSAVFAERFSFKHIFPTEEVIIEFDNGISKIGKKINEMGLDGLIFMNSLMSLVNSKKTILLEQIHFANNKSIFNLPEPIIVNCTSMGAAQLFHDDEFIPVRGHLVYFKPQAGIDYSFHQNVPGVKDYWVMLYPWQDRLILGGIFQEGNNNNHIDDAVIKKLLQHARSCFAK